MTHTQQMRSDKRQRFRAFRELVSQEATVPAIAARLKVSERTVLRYLRDLEGPRRRSMYDDLMPRVLAHLQRFPSSEFTSTELARVLGVGYGNHEHEGKYDGAALNPTLRRMEREGLVRSVPGIRADANYNVPLPCTRWRLAQAGDA
ncbi:hypothetical protein [Nonomuraea sp. NPDC049480]|uniref:hypothetical protein n=1 Tax=Nonomuraea sp. NPDC049480 TaxID=3364353 RepID=UPI0037BB2E3C